MTASVVLLTRKKRGSRAPVQKAGGKKSGSQTYQPTRGNIIKD